MNVHHLLEAVVPTVNKLNGLPLLVLVPILIVMCFAFFVFVLPSIQELRDQRHAVLQTIATVILSRSEHISHCEYIPMFLDSAIVTSNVLYVPYVYPPEYFVTITINGTEYSEEVAADLYRCPNPNILVSYKVGASGKIYIKKISCAS